MENFSRPLVDWYKKEARPLPWREEPTPYRVWVSEIMLQQTRIEAAREYFNRFTRAFPTVEALAAAELDDVLKLWEGLGYYSRARNLHKCAKTVCETYGGVFPPDAAALRALPGIGDYTAGAIASIAYGLPEPAVDGNVLRVLARMECFGESIGSDKVKKRFREALRDIYPTGECGAFTSALMELGETVCTVGTPSCARCPVAAYCAAHRCGAIERSLPMQMRSKTGGCCFCSAAIRAPCSGVRIRGFSPRCGSCRTTFCRTRRKPASPAARRCTFSAMWNGICAGTSSAAGRSFQAMSG